MYIRFPYSLSLLVGYSLLSGCFLFHGSGDDTVLPPGADGGSIIPGPDGGLDGNFDGGIDGDLDAMLDGSLDAIPDALIVDGELRPPTAPSPPDPDTCRIEPTIHPFDDPVVEYEWPEGPVVHSDSVHVSSTPLVIDLTPEPDSIEPVLVFVSYPPLRGSDEPPGILRIVDPRTNTTISYPPREGELGVLEATTNIAAGDINGDGENEIVGIGRYSGSFAFRADGTLLWESSYPSAVDRGLRWDRTFSGAPAIADLEGDGTVEIIIGRNVLDGATGTRRWTGGDGTGRGSNQYFGFISCVADLTGDGNQEVVAGHTAFRANGTVLWNHEYPDGFCAVADMVTSNPGPEVVLISSGYLRILAGATGEQLWIRRLEGRVRTGVGGAPTVADFDGDGHPEIGVAHGSDYGVYDQECISRDRPAGCLGDGLLWKSETSDASSAGTGSSVFDFNGDGRAEVVYNDEYYFRIYDGTTGRELFERRNSSRTRTENPAIADVDNDGDAEIVFCANAEAEFLRTEFWTDPGVEIWGDALGRWVGARRIWNQHAYHITNVEENGAIPRRETDSWTLLNAYRQNLREGGDVLVAPDLWGGHGSYECSGGNRAVLTVEVANWGLERAGSGVIVGFYRGNPDAGGVRVAEAETTRSLGPRGDSEMVSVEVTLMDPVIDYYALIDDPGEGMTEGVIFECREGNNASLIWRPDCP